MEKERLVRLQYPPLILMAAIILGAILDPKKPLEQFLANLSGGSIKLVEILAVIAGGGAVLFASGFIIGSLSVSLLRAMFWLADKLLPKDTFFGKQLPPRPWHYEATVLSEESLTALSCYFGVDTQRHQNRDVFCMLVSFDHEVLEGPVHNWLRRRWHAFNISCHSLVAIWLALPVGQILEIKFSWQWTATALGASLIFSWSGAAAWLGSMRMIDFQSRRRIMMIDKPSKKKNQPNIINQENGQGQ